MAPNFLIFAFSCLQREEQRRAADRCAAAAECPDAVLHHGGVAVHHQHVVHGDAELVRHDLREGGLLALPVRRRAGHHGDLARGFDLHRGRFPAARRQCDRRTQRADLAVSGDADPHQPALGRAPPPDPAASCLVADLVHRLVQRLRVIAAVVHQPRRGRERELVVAARSSSGGSPPGPFSIPARACPPSARCRASPPDGRRRDTRRSARNS